MARLQSLKDPVEELRNWNKSLEDLSRSITRGEESLRLNSNNAVMANLGRSYSRRTQQTRSFDDLTRAIDLFENSVESISDDHIDRPSRLHALGTALMMRYRWLKSST